MKFHELKPVSLRSLSVSKKMSTQSLRHLVVIALICSGALFAAPQAGTATPVVIGQRFEFTSEVLGKKRTITIRLPRGYTKSDARYPVVYVLDGESNFRPVESAVEFLARHGKIPEHIVVAVHNAGSRRADMTPSKMRLDRRPGHAERFLDFIERELIPYIEKSYRCQPLRVLHGHSHGAILGTFALATRPKLFRWHLTLDMPPRRADSFLEQAVLDRLRDGKHPNGRLVSAEQKYGWTDEDWGKLSKFAPKTFYARRFEVRGETHSTMLYEGTYEGFKRLYHDYSKKETRTKTLADLRSEYRSLSLAYGYEIAIPRSLLEINVFDLLCQQRGKEAKELAEYLEAQHGSKRGMMWDASMIQKAIDAGPPKESVAALIARARPSARELRPFVGVWTGTMRAPNPQPLRIKIAVLDGKASAAIYSKFSGQPWRPKPVVTIKLRADGILEVGVINNMRPFGIMMYELEKDGEGSLTGRIALRGASLRIVAPHVEMTAMTLRLKAEKG